MGWEELSDMGVNVACKQDSQSMAGAISLRRGNGDTNTDGGGVRGKYKGGLPSLRFEKA